MKPEDVKYLGPEKLLAEYTTMRGSHDGSLDTLNLYWAICGELIDRLRKVPPAEKPKKTVVKEVVCDGYIISRLKSTNHIPQNARSVRCTYEIEE